jgi:adenylate cyclase
MSTRRTTRADLLAGAEAIILGTGRRYTPAEVWPRADVDEELAGQLWLAMGFPNLPADDPVLTAADIAALQRAKQLLDDGAFDDVGLRHQTRIMSQALSTIATAHAETLDPTAADGPDVAGLLERGTVAVLDELLVYLYHRHLLAAMERVLLAHADESAAPGTATLTGVVGFVDLAGFTSVTATLPEAELTGVVDGFASLAADIIATEGGRVVKLIGDEVMFSVEDPLRAVEAGLALAESVEAHEDLSSVHAGLALGPLVGHHGDLFGPTVNLASRLADVAKPGSVLVNGQLAAAVREDRRFQVRRVHLRPLKGIGPVEAFVVRRSA